LPVRRKNPFVRVEDPFRTEIGTLSYGRMTRSYGGGNRFVRGREFVRTGGGSCSYGGGDPFVRRVDTVRTEGVHLSYGRGDPFVRDMKTGESGQEPVGGLKESGDRETVGTGL